MLPVLTRIYHCRTRRNSNASVEKEQIEDFNVDSSFMNFDLSNKVLASMRIRRNLIVSGYIVIVQFLVNAAGNDEVFKQMMQTADSEGDTPLHHAAGGEYLDVVNFLLLVGASPTTRNAYGKTPADLVESGLAVQSVLEAAAHS